jgi:hypothetical protein
MKTPEHSRQTNDGPEASRCSVLLGGPGCIMVNGWISTPFQRRTSRVARCIFVRMPSGLQKRWLAWDRARSRAAQLRSLQRQLMRYDLETGGCSSVAYHDRLTEEDWTAWRLQRKRLPRPRLSELGIRLAWARMIRSIELSAQQIFRRIFPLRLRTGLECSISCDDGVRLTTQAHRRPGDNPEQSAKEKTNDNP